MCSEEYAMSWHSYAHGLLAFVFVVASLRRTTLQVVHISQRGHPRYILQRGTCSRTRTPIGGICKEADMGLTTAIQAKFISTIRVHAKTHDRGLMRHGVCKEWPVRDGWNFTYSFGLFPTSGHNLRNMRAYLAICLLIISDTNVRVHHRFAHASRRTAPHVDFTLHRDWLGTREHGLDGFLPYRQSRLLFLG